MDEKTSLIQKYIEAENAQDAAMKALDKYFSPKVRALIAEKKLDEAWELGKECPCQVLRAFYWDALRHAGFIFPNQRNA